ncbi:MAG TPA: nicotinate phosphoribosyltransferase [Terriglobales bacterium]|nr:nicotinate phosphoribosyltransferase [Terriglobales bacterium]
MSEHCNHSWLLTDLYELTMSAAFFENDCNPTASFELFVRSLPPERKYLLVAGLEQAMDFISNARFTGADIEFLRGLPVFHQVQPGFFEYLRDLRFTGDVWAVPEGTVAFGEEPLLRVTAPIIEAQLLETYLIATITYQTMVASKAARIVYAAQGREVVEFGTRRAHGPVAGTTAARAAYIAGCAGTSNVEAGARFGIPTFGTIAHSFVMAAPDEEEAFERYSRVFPDSSVLLLDTYDTLAAVDKIVAAKLQPRGVRLDSGDLAELSKQVRHKLDAAGLQQTKILASGDLDEYRITELLSQGAAIDGFGVGTSLTTSKDAPSLGGVYKIVEVKNQEGKSYVAKFSENKMTYPGTKQVFRFSDRNGTFTHDLIACAGEEYANADELVEPMINAGARISEQPPSMQEIRSRARQQLERLPSELRATTGGGKYEVQFSQELQRLLQLARDHAHAREHSSLHSR